MRALTIVTLLLLTACADGGAPGRAAEGGTCGGIAGLACGEDDYCAYPADAACGAADRTGSCRPRPQACTLDYRPVCGCDGRTYANACQAAAAGSGVASTGECPPGR